MNTQYHSRTYYHLRLLAVLFMSLAVLSYVSPQVGQLGRGLRTTLPALAVAWFAITRLSPNAFSRALSRYRLALFAGGLYLLQAGLRFTYMSDASIFWTNFFISPFMMLTFLLFITALAEVGDDALLNFRRWFIFLWCTSLILGLPALINNPGVARLTMLKEIGPENAAEWAPYGVGQFNVYTSLAICSAPLMMFVRRLKKISRGAMFFVAFLAFLSVIISTFTMAVVLLMLSFLAYLFVWVTIKQGASKMLRAAAVLIFLAFTPSAYYQVTPTPHTQFVIDKLESLYEGISTEGLERGDATLRGLWFIDELEVFAEEPFIGYIPGVKGTPGNGHSSLSNSLVLFGIFGAALWATAIGNIARDTIRHAKDLESRYVAIAAWIIYAMSGILNPTWHSAAIFGTLLVFTLPSRTDRNEPEVYAGSGKQ